MGKVLKITQNISFAENYGIPCIVVVCWQIMLGFLWRISVSLWDQISYHCLSAIPAKCTFIVLFFFASKWKLDCKQKISKRNLLLGFLESLSTFDCFKLVTSNYSDQEWILWNWIKKVKKFLLEVIFSERRKTFFS